MKSIEQIARECFELYMQQTTQRQTLDWEEVADLYRDAWETIVLYVLQNQANISDRPVVTREFPTEDENADYS